tara:strand:+ start:568 stop:1257 length:690 start_codon:yes stop_codon:yes gene_type:complete
MWFTAGEDATVTVDYIVDGEYVTPDSATYRLLTADGTVALSGSLPAESTTESVVIPAAQTAIIEEHESRFLKLEFVYASRVYHKMLSISLTGFLPLTGTPDDVRQTMGLDPLELKDEHVDLIGAYFDLRWANGDGFKQGLLAGGPRAISTNRAVVLKAALKICNSLPMRTHIVVQSEDSRVQRSAKIDFDAMRAEIEAQLAEEVNVAAGVTIAATTLFALSNPEDPFSG